MAGCSATSGRWPARDLWAVALRSRAPPPVACPAIGRQAEPAATVPQRRARTDSRGVLQRRAVSHRERSPSRARLAARRSRDGASATLDTDLSRQDLGTYQEDGVEI